MSNLSMAEEEPKSRRPKDTKFKQQRLPAWQPMLTASTVLPLLFAIGIGFIPLGVAFLITANNVHEKLVDYTWCKSDGNVTCAEYIESNLGATSCSCRVTFDLTDDFTGQVFMYYSLTNYYQNHRRYVKSRDDDQLRGEDVGYSSLTSDCSPFIGNSSTRVAYAPCGAIANSIFNDTLSIVYLDNDTEINIGVLKRNIAWSTDRNVKFRNPEEKVQSDSVPPPNWQRSVWQLNGNDSENNGYENEDLIVWMRTAALPSFRKLYRRINHVGLFQNGLPKGNYSLLVSYTYPVIAFGGTKRMILSTTSWLGGKNPFLGIAYIVVGGMCIVIGFIFLLVHLRIGQRSKRSHSLELTVTTPYHDGSVAVSHASSI